jgi:hypothetical protein
MKLKRKIAFSIIALLLLFIAFIGRNSFENLLLGKVHFPEELVGTELTMEDGLKFSVFRRLKVTSNDNNPESPAVFKVRFKFKNLGISTNKRLSIIPAPFLVGMDGFLEKDWTINDETNEFQGIYQWSSTEAAERYPDTFIFKLMTKRAVPGTVSYEILPNTDLSGYLSAICNK